MEVKVDNTLKWRLMPSKARLKNFWNLKNKQTFHFNNHSQIFSLCLNFSLCHRKIFSLCLKIFPCVKAKFPVFSLSGKSKNQIPCFPCAVATLRKYYQVRHYKTLRLHLLTTVSRSLFQTEWNAEVHLCQLPLSPVICLMIATLLKLFWLHATPHLRRCRSQI